MQKTVREPDLRGYLLKVAGGLALILALGFLIGYNSPHPEMRDVLPYTVSTVFRITFTLAISVLWGVSFGILAATNKTASLIVTPIVDLLQSVPILGYFPLVIGFLFAYGPLGIEFSIILLLFTSMAWSVFFGVLGAVKTIPTDVIEASKSFGIGGWKYTRHVVIPAVIPAVIAGANLAWSDGWFFTIAAEYIQYKSQVIVPASGGIGMLLAKAAYEWEDVDASGLLLVYITVLIVVVNSLTWHKLMDRANSGTFKPIIQLGLSGVGLLGGGHRGWLNLHNIQLPKSFSAIWQRLSEYTRRQKLLTVGIVLLVLGWLFYQALGALPSWALVMQGLSQPPGEKLMQLPALVLLTMGRLSAAYVVSLVIAIGLGVAAAESKTAAAIIYPIYDIGQGVPILALFPVIYVELTQLFGSARVALEVTCIIMLVLDMIWYMFINVTSAVKTIPSEITEVSRLFGFKGLKRITHIVIPSILPAIVTGSILSWGTGWNTIIFSEYLPSSDPAVPAVFVPGIGSLLDEAGYVYGNTVILVVVLAIISIIVLLMEALVWRRLLRRFEKFKVEM